MTKARSFNPAMLLFLFAGIAIFFIVLSALTGPAIGNIYSNITGSLIPSSGVSQTGQASTQLTGYESAPSQSLDERIIIRNAMLRIVVADAESVMTYITQLAADMGGWVVNSNTSRVSTASGEEVSRGTITVRVEASRLDDALNHIKSEAVSVDTESVTGEGVTQQYVDLTSRLHNLEAAETQLQSIMESARRTEDVLNVYNELVRVRGEIEVIRGQIQYYEEASSYSSISVELVPQALETPVQIAGWSPVGTARAALTALLSVLRFTADLLITVAVFGLPLALIFGLPGWLAYRRLHRRA